ncbi:MAG: acyl-CoA desaturase, partial [Cytophagales bacterium]
FETQKISKKGNFGLYLKTAIMFAMYIVPYWQLLTGNYNDWQSLIWIVVMAVGTAGIGLSVMHDANHGTYSENKWVNLIMGESLTMIGGNSYTWKIQHNVLHHTYTNVYGHDEDVDTKFLIKLSKNAKTRWYHKYQHVYAWLLYGLLTVAFLFKDFRQMYTFNKAGYYKNNGTSAIFEVIRLLITKSFYVFYIIIVPIFYFNIPVHKVLIGFFLMHLITGFILSTVFQLAHIMEDTEHPLPDEDGKLENVWAEHQLKTTCNFSNKNKLVTWYTGGLNHQIEHHLFPTICHVHYPAISKIVKETAKEFGLPYYEYENMFVALRSHVNTLKEIGHAQPSPQALAVMA